MQSQAPAHYRDSRRFYRVPPLNAAAFVEKVLERGGPIWCRWDRDLLALQNALTAAAGDLSSFNPTGQAEISEFAVRQELLLWFPNHAPIVQHNLEVDRIRRRAGRNNGVQICLVEKA